MTRRQLLFTILSVKASAETFEVGSFTPKRDPFLFLTSEALF
jgi:hypothetical protein